MIKYAIGIIALGIVIFVHELGHYIAARLAGVTVHTFSLGWGPVLLRKKIGETEYRLSAFPIGGYCGMKGENAFREALDSGSDGIKREPGSFYSAHPAKRIAIAFAGPFANLLLAVIAYALVSAFGYQYRTWENRIVPAWLFEGQTESPAKSAGLLPGDRIISLDGSPTDTYSDIQQYVSTRPEEQIMAEIDREGSLFSTALLPELDRKTGSGRIGIYPFIPLVIGSIKEGSAADTAGLKVGDVINSVNGILVTHYLEYERSLADKPEQVLLSLDRNGIALTKRVVVLYGDAAPETGIGWKQVEVLVKGTDPLTSLINGLKETEQTLELTVKGISLLFRGVDVAEAVSGPVRITYLIGEVAQGGFTGLAQLLGIICVSLFLMNLLPVPVLDGGLILLTLIELLRRKPIKPKMLYYAQFAGMAFILCIFALALFSDITFLSK